MLSGVLFSSQSRKWDSSENSPGCQPAAHLSASHESEWRSQKKPEVSPIYAKFLHKIKGIRGTGDVKKRVQKANRQLQRWSQRFPLSLPREVLAYNTKMHLLDWIIASATSLIHSYQKKKNQQRSHLTTFKKEDFLSWVKWIFKLTTTKSDSKSESDWVPRCLTALQVDCGDKSSPPFYYWGGNVLTKLTLTPFCFSFLPSHPLFFLFLLPTIPVSYTHLTLPTRYVECISRWSPYH